jgi:hypothetical protein
MVTPERAMASADMSRMVAHASHRQWPPMYVGDLRRVLVFTTLQSVFCQQVNNRHLPTAVGRYLFVGAERMSCCRCAGWEHRVMTSMTDAECPPNCAGCAGNA